MTTDSTQDSDEYRVTHWFKAGEVFVGIAEPANRKHFENEHGRFMGLHSVRFALTFAGLLTAPDFYFHCLADLAKAVGLAETVVLASEFDRR